MEMLETIEKETMSDFKNLLSKVDFNSYSPYDKEYMKALFVGQMWDLVHDLNKAMSEHKDHMEMLPVQIPQKYSDIEEEIDGAKKYMKMSESTGDAQYKSMASDELRHAEILLKKAQAKNPVPAEQKVLHEMEELHNSLKAKL